MIGTTAYRCHLHPGFGEIHALFSICVTIFLMMINGPCTQTMQLIYWQQDGTTAKDIFQYFLSCFTSFSRKPQRNFFFHLIGQTQPLWAAKWHKMCWIVFKFGLLFYLLCFVHECTHMSGCGHTNAKACMSIEVRGQYPRVGSLLPPHGS